MTLKFRLTASRIVLGLIIFSLAGLDSLRADTNAFTTVILGRVYVYDQTSTNLPTLNPDIPYEFTSSVTLKTNLTVNTVKVTLPTGSVSNYVADFAANQYHILDEYTNLATLTSIWPDGSYSVVLSGTSTLQIPLTLSASLSQPPAPHISNFLATEAVDPTKPFTLTWDPFPGGTKADYVEVSFGPFLSPNPYEAGALNGTATSLVIPANTLSNYNTAYGGGIAFFRYNSTTNTSAPYIAYAGLETGTEFAIETIDTNIISGPITLTAPVLANGFSFTVNAIANQTVTIEGTSNLNSPVWQTLITTNSPNGTWQFTDSRGNTNTAFYYRAVSGP
jgi:hypothetical protein